MRFVQLPQSRLIIDQGLKKVENHDSLPSPGAPPRPRKPAIRITQDGFSRPVDAACRTPSNQYRSGGGNEVIQPENAEKQQNGEGKCNQQHVPAGNENVLIHPKPPGGAGRHMSGFSCGHTAYRLRIGNVLGTEVTEKQGAGIRE